MKMANMDAVLDFMFTNPKYADGVSLFLMSYQNIFVVYWVFLLPFCMFNGMIIDLKKIKLAFISFPNMPWFLRVYSTSHLKTLWEKEKLLMMSNWAIYPFPNVFSCSLENFLPFSSNLKSASAKPFDFEESKICRLGKG